MIRYIVKISLIIIALSAFASTYTFGHSRDSLITIKTTSPAEMERFLKRNPNVKGISWSNNDKIYIYLKDGTHQSYSLKNPDEIQAAERTYGRLPKYDVRSYYARNVTKGSTLAGTGPVFDKLVLTVDPEYIYGMKAFDAYIKRNFKPPVTSDGDIRTRTIVVRFVVEPDGSLTNVNVIRDFHDGSAEEAVRVVREAGKWKPGIKDGTPVRVFETYAIKVK